MKEKISCSLDGEIIKRIDGIISSFPFIQSRSAVIEMAIINLQDDIWISAPDVTENHFVTLYGRRCELDAQKESKN